MLRLPVLDWCNRTKNMQVREFGNSRTEIYTPWDGHNPKVQDGALFMFSEKKKNKNNKKDSREGL